MESSSADYQTIMGKYEEIVAFFEHLGLSRDPDSVERVYSGLGMHLTFYGVDHLQFLQICEPNLKFRISLACMVHMVRRGTKTLFDVTSWLEESK